jgi:co-chaperonin GroES (HSP10)
LVDAAFSERVFQRVSADSKDFVCPDKYIFARVQNKKIIPFGRRVMIRRDISEQKQGEIVAVAEAQPGTDQSLFGTVVSLGILPHPTNKKGKKNWKNAVWHSNVGIGDRIRLAKWTEHMIELNEKDNFYLIVSEDDLLYSIHEQA